MAIIFTLSVAFIAVLTRPVYRGRDAREVLHPRTVITKQPPSMDVYLINIVWQVEVRVAEGGGAGEVGVAEGKGREEGRNTIKHTLYTRHLVQGGTKYFICRAAFV